MPQVCCMCVLCKDGLFTLKEGRLCLDLSAAGIVFHHAR